jgi:hypothetical protein
MNTPRHKKVVTLTLDPDLWDELGAWIAKQEIRHPKNAVVEKAIRKFLDGNSSVQLDCSGDKGA